MRALRAISLAAAVLFSGTVLDVASAASPALAATAGVAGVAVGTGSAAGELVVKGTQQRFLPHGINSVGVMYPAALAYTNAVEKNYMLAHCPTKIPVQGLTGAQTAMTTDTDTELLAMAEHWQADTVRFHISQGALAYEYAHHSFASGNNQYTDMAVNVIRQARAMGLVVDIDVDTEPYTCTTSTGMQKLPTTDTEHAWTQLLQQLAAVNLGNDPGIILEPFNEPDSGAACGTQTWQNWEHACSGYLGMENVGQWLAQQAPNQVLLFDADNGGSTFAGFSPPAAMPANSAYAIHPFYFTDGPTGWNTRFGDLEASGHAVFANAWNQSANPSCSTDGALASQLVQSYLPRHNIGLSMQSWDAPAAGLVNQPLGSGNPAAGDPVDMITVGSTTCPTAADVVYDQYWSDAGVSVAAPAVAVSPPLTWLHGVVDGATVALADNGSPFGTSPVVPPSDVASSVDVLVQPAGSQTSTWVAKMNLTGPAAWWDNGTYTRGTVSGLSGKSVTAGSGATLIFRVRYQGVSGFQDTDYKVP
ncbi:MAG TPA: cellulase family glycosylhydrolase [Streptosporangiaceae bacterium]|nr:cellulase family glycosylhydrolase [Streptosporangiaceae bacterium]